MPWWRVENLPLLPRGITASGSRSGKPEPRHKARPRAANLPASATARVAISRVATSSCDAPRGSRCPTGIGAVLRASDAHWRPPIFIASGCTLAGDLRGGAASCGVTHDPFTDSAGYDIATCGDGFHC